MTVTEDTIVAGKPLAYWKTLFEPVAGGFAEPHPELRGDVGVLRAVLDGRVVFVGRAAEWRNGGLAKRTRDFSRPSDSGRRHYAGRMIHEHRHVLRLEVLVTGGDGRAAGLAKLLCAAFIKLDRPKWNVGRRYGTKVTPIRTAAPSAAPPKLRLSAAHLTAPKKRKLAA